MLIGRLTGFVSTDRPVIFRICPNSTRMKGIWLIVSALQKERDGAGGSSVLEKETEHGNALGLLPVLECRQYSRCRPSGKQQRLTKL
jgi:hypothetical protein